ncbi:MAG: nicotinamide riboside transporter PnuC [Spirochaetes bacterium]|nr:nicotinamide riboside transporter PnuC [Spirochaetota bacterium]
MPFPSFLFDPAVVMATVSGYELSWLEFLGVATGLACVVLAARERVSNWPVGIVNNLFFFELFRHTGLYPDMFLQVFYAATAIYGWWRWLSPKGAEEANARNQLRITRLSRRTLAAWIAATLSGAAALGFLVSGLDRLLPAFFPVPASMPFADALVASASVAATFLMAGKRLECWWFWCLTDLFAAFVYASRGIAFLSLEYAAFALIAAAGIASWTREFRSYGPSFPAEAPAPVEP